jgi:FkbH-like protein
MLPAHGLDQEGGTVPGEMPTQDNWANAQADPIVPRQHQVSGIDTAAAAADARPKKDFAGIAVSEISLRHCLDAARAHERAGDHAAALRWVFTGLDAGDDLAGWTAAAQLARRCLAQVGPLPRSAKVAVLGSYTTSQLAALLPVAAARTGVAAEVYECGYGQYQQEILDPSSGLYRFAPDVVVLAVHASEARLPAVSDDPEADVAREVARWTSLWETIATRSGARMVQHTFAVPPEVPLGHLTTRVPGSRAAMLAAVNAELGRAAADQVALVDCDRLAAEVGKRRWFDARYWNRAKQAVALDCVSILARHTAAVIGAQLGVSRKCLVLDLDNTLWGGVLGEEGLAGIALGDGPIGEAFTAFQEYILELKSKGVILAVCSKNNEADVREVFENHVNMRIKLDDIAAFSASWDDKPAQLRAIAANLGIGMDSLVFVDDNPVEREVVRQLAPGVDVIEMPADPHAYVRALAGYPYFESVALTSEDAARTAQYRARADAARAAAAATSLDDFHRDLEMVAAVVPLDDLTQPRVVQLIGKTNQFNLTGRRRGDAEVAALAADPATTVLCLRLADRFTDHGLVGVVIAVQRGTVLDIDTWLMSCRVIGRTLEDETAAVLVGEARRRGCTLLRGRYLPTAKNGLVAELYPRLGFVPADGADDPLGDAAGGTEGAAQPAGSTWVLDVATAKAPPGLMRVVDADGRSVEWQGAMT